MKTKEEILKYIDEEFQQDRETAHTAAKAKAYELLEQCNGNYDNARTIAQGTSMASWLVYEILTTIQTKEELNHA